MEKTLSLLAACLVCIFIIGNAHAKNFNLKYYTLATEKDPYGQASVRLGQAVEKATNGTIKFTFYFRSKLGPELDAIKQVSRGRIEIGGFSLTAAAAMVPELGVIGTPFLFDSYQQNDCVLDDHLANRFEGMFLKKGLKLVSLSESGTVSVFGTRPIITPADAVGWKLRITQAKYSILLWQAVGANPVPLPVSEHHAALQTGLVDGGAYTPIIYVLLGFHKLAPHLTMTQHSITPGFILLSQKVWNRFSDLQKKQFMSAVEGPERIRREVRGLESILVEKYKQQGGKVYTLSEEQKQKWLDKVVPKQEKIVDMIGRQSAMIWKTIQNGKTACSR